MKVFRPLLIAGLALAHHAAYATSFDCRIGHSLTEKMICHDPALSKLDDTLGQLYWKARRRVVNRREFLNDSDSKWAWREANCHDIDCLTTWYATRIEQLTGLIASMQAGATPSRSVAPRVVAQPADAHDAPAPMQAPAPVPTAVPIEARTEVARAECTASNPGLVVGEQCSTVLGQNIKPWKYKPRDGEWFCGVAMLPPSQTQTDEVQ